MPLRVTQNSFVAGELAPELWGRQDLKKYFEGAATLRNMVVQRTGGVTKRQGTDLLDDLTTIAGWGGTTQGCRLIPFVYDNETSFLVVLTHLKAYFYRNGVPVFADGRTTIYSIDTTYDYEMLAGLRFFQSGDTIFIMHPDSRPSKLVRWDDADWRLSSLTFDIAVSAPTGLSVTGYTGNGAYTEVTSSDAFLHEYVVSAVIDGVESKPCAAVSFKTAASWPANVYLQLLWNAVDGAQNYRIYKRDFASYGFIGNAPVTTQLGETYTIVDASCSALATGYNDNSLAKLNDGIINDTTGSPAYNTSVCVFASSTSTTVVCDLSTSKSIRGIRFAFGASALKSDGSVAVVGGNCDLISIHKSTNGTTWSAVVTERSISALGVSDSFFNTNWTPSAARYWKVIFKKTGWEGSYDSCIRAFREIQWFSLGTPESFIDRNITPDTTDSPTDATDPWDEDTGYPSVMTLFQQRSVWAGVASLPTQILMSTIGNLYCFNNSTPLKPEDKIDVRLPVIRPGDIKHLVPMRQLLILTESSEWIVTFDESKGLAYDTMRMHQNSFFGCCGIEPISIGNSALFIDRSARAVLEYQYQLANDGFAAQDRTILSNHLTAASRITCWAHQKEPHSVIWCALEDGSMIAMTYLPEHEIWAWSRHDLAGGKVLDIVAPGSNLTYMGAVVNTSEVYLLVERGDQVMLERMRAVPNSDAPTCGMAVCMDMVQRIELGSAQTTFAIPDTATAIPDGNYTVVDLETGAAQSATVTSGTVTVATAVRYLLLGKTITSQIETLRPEGQQVPLQTARQNVKSMVLRLYRSGGGTAGALGARTSEIALPDSTPTVTASEEGDPDCTVNLVSTDSRLSMPGMFSRTGQTSITHASHWPMSILSMATELDVESGR